MNQSILSRKLLKVCTLPAGASIDAAVGAPSRIVQLTGFDPMDQIFPRQLSTGVQT
jgi:hypothetical protein